jgi:autotransporter translocation and assembly factor TamB
LRAFWRSILVLMSLVVMLVVVAPFTGWGSRSLLNLVQLYAPLEIEYRSGSLASRLELDRLAYVTDQVGVELVDIDAEVRAACFLRSALCFSRLQVASLDVQLPESTGEDEGAGDPDPGVVESTPRALISFPLPIESDALSIASLRVRWTNGEWRQGQTRLALSLRDSSIHVLQASMASPVLELRGGGAAKPVSEEPVVLPLIDLPLELSVDELLLLEPSWNIYGTGAEHEALSLRGLWRRTQLHIDHLETSAEDLGSLSFGGDIEFSGGWPLQVDGELVATGSIPWEGLGNEPVAFTLTGSLDALAARLNTRGVPALSVVAELDALDPRLPFQARLEASGPDGLALGELAAVPAQLEELELVLPWSATLEGSISRQSFELRGALTGLGYQDVQLDVGGVLDDGLLSLHSLRLLDASGASRLSASGNLRLGDKPVVSLSFSSPGFSLPAISDQLAGRLEGKLDLGIELAGDQWRLSVSGVDLRGDVNNLPARASGIFFLDQDWGMHGTDLKAEVNDARLSLRASPDGLEPGTLVVDIADLGRWQSGVGGRFRADVRVVPALEQLVFEGELQALQWGGIDADQARFSGRFNPGDRKAFELSLVSSALDIGRMELTELDLAVAGDEARQTGRLTIGGDVAGELILTGTGWGETWRGALAPAALETAHGNWELARALKMQWLAAPEQLAVEDHCWRWLGASICAGDLRLGAEGGARIEATGELANLDSLLPTGMKLQGSMQLEATGRWGPERGLLLEGRYATENVVATRQYSEGEYASARWDRGGAELRYGEDSLSLQWSLSRDQRQVLGLDLQIPMSGDRPLQGRVAVNRLQLDPLVAFLPAMADLRGELSGEFTLDGSLEAPLANGELRLSGGELGLVGNPTPLKQLELGLQLRGERAVVAGDGLLGGGPVRLRGEMSLQPQLALDLQVEGERQNVLYPPATQLLLSESLRIVAVPGLVRVTGDITVHQGSLEPEVLPEGSVAVSTDVVEVDYQGNVIRRQLPFDLDMDVRIVVEDRFEVRSSLMLATLGGELHVLQRPGQPLQLFGTLNVIGGEVRAYQQQLRIQRGSLSFTGRPDNPSIDVRAVRNIGGGNVQVGMHIRGSYEALKMEVFSVPHMSQGEAMSYLIRGRGLDASAGEDGTALALSVASGVVNRSTLVSELNRIPGVSDVSFGSDGSAEDTAATVSGYIGNRIYLSYGIGVYEPINVLIARLYLRTRLWLEVVSRLENSVDLYYAFDID